MKLNPPQIEDNETTAHYTQRRVVVIATGIATMLIAMSAVWAGWKYLPDMPTLFPIREVTFNEENGGNIMHTTAEELKQIANAIVHGSPKNLLRVDLAEVQVAVKQLPWVRSADVRRRFPDSLQIRIEEHLPVAVLKGDEPMLINSMGEAFKVSATESNLPKMPVFIGSPASSPEMLKQFREFELSLATIERHVVELHLSPRDAWQITLDNGAVISLGRNDVAARLQRLLNAWPNVAVMQTAGAHIDLRYNNGFALSNVSLPAKPKNG